ncbi:conserved hypothetical protein [Talaromyces stipitatus ATCC 10500]|uniref:Integrase catalytic domain-containing protein n=1 Tax=Talaromyces stipitatus (strain ATCC 10500 / CBS 375.48 / QM 6759 / NRRL 1006) TaxID=441959 RepID=B8MV27_TALSN|nr:uncharacterized protein TSTA_110950 [Talaromyces stipitatus ATCC 10500]EED11916.1 conserved hypothetical protein [Talaromyces stipitatus ATCC 10500]
MAGTATVQFGPGDPYQSIGSIDVPTPISTIRFYILTSTTSFLMSLYELDKLKLYFDNTCNLLVNKKTGKTTPVIRQFGHPFLVWDYSYHTYLLALFDHNPCLLTNAKLHRLHCRFRHPSTNRLRRVLTRAGHETNKEAIEYIRKFCHHCQMYDKSPGRFRFTLHENVNFNHSIIINIMYLDRDPVLHIVDEATHFNAAAWLPNISTKVINIYLGPPDLVITDAGKTFTSREFSQSALAVGTIIKTVLVEAHWSIRTVKRHHAMIRRSYEIIKKELPDLPKDAALQMAVKTVNDTASPDGLVPTLLVFGAYPRIVEYNPPAPTIT